MDQQDVLNGQGEEQEPASAVGEEQAEPKVTPETSSASTSPMEMLLEEEGLGLDFPKQGEIRSGMIATIGENEILVSVGTKSEGVISGRELEQIPDEEREAFDVGVEIPVYVLTPEDSNGNVVLSYTRAREEKDWEDAEEMISSSTNFDSKIIGFNKGGLLVPLGRLRGFVPASQVSLVRRATVTGDTPDQRWGKMVGEPITVRVIEVDRERRRLILSEKAALQETRETLKERLLEELEEGDVRNGRVTSVADFGAFVNIDGADGLVHLSELSWERIQHPSEVLKVGQEVEVKVITIDRERKRIGLSLRQLQPDPWLKQVEHLKEGQLIEAKVTHLTKFGAFARLDENLEGLIHVSELSDHRVAHPKEVVKEGDQVTLRVIKIDPDRRRIGLSLRKVDSAAYSDLDWKMALAEEVVEVQESKDSDEPIEVVDTLDEADEGISEVVEEAPADEDIVSEVEAVTVEDVEVETAGEDEIVEVTETIVEEIVVDEAPAEDEVVAEIEEVIFEEVEVETADEAEIVEVEETIVEAIVVDEVIDEVVDEADGEAVGEVEAIISAEVVAEEETVSEEETTIDEPETGEIEESTSEDQDTTEETILEDDEVKAD